MNAQQSAALAALAVLAASLAWRMMDETALVDPGQPRSNAAPPRLLAAMVPAIGDFDGEFHVNWDNPFLPYHERVVERTERTRPPRPATTTIKPPPPVTNAPIKPVEPKRLVLPPPQSSKDTAPECIGIMRHGPSQQAVVMTRLPGQPPTPLAEGDALAGWTLIEIGPGTARFRRPDGGEELLPVGGEVPDNLTGDGAQMPSVPAIPSATQPRQQPQPGSSSGSARQPMPQTVQPLPQTVQPVPAPAGEPVLRQRRRNPNEMQDDPALMNPDEPKP